jgi:glycine betaine transporter
MQQTILSIAIIITLLSSLYILFRWRNVVCEGEIPTKLFAFIAILFTSGLDVGLIMFPLTEFPTYATEEAANPLAIEFGFWGVLVWVFYFLTTFYFCKVEPKVKIFQIPLIKFLNNVVIIGTCAFTGFLFLSYLPNYIEGITPVGKYALVGIVVLFAVLSSTDVKYVKLLSVASTWVFFVLILLMWSNSSMGFSGLAITLTNIGEYFTHIDRFISPLTDYHAFYLFWWFSWSIMIGQFVARFVGGLKTWQLFLALTIIPSIPIAIWFSVLYYYFTNAIEVAGFLKTAMVVVGVVFVINSLDSLIRLYTVNLNLTMKTIGKSYYIIGNWLAIFGLILLYQFTPLEIEWIGLIVIGIYIVVYTLLIKTYVGKVKEPLELL